MVKAQSEQKEAQEKLEKKAAGRRNRQSSKGLSPAEFAAQQAHRGETV